MAAEDTGRCSRRPVSGQGRVGHRCDHRFHPLNGGNRERSRNNSRATSAEPRSAPGITPMAALRQRIPVARSVVVRRAVAVALCRQIAATTAPKTPRSPPPWDINAFNRACLSLLVQVNQPEQVIPPTRVYPDFPAQIARLPGHLPYLHH